MVVKEKKATLTKRAPKPEDNADTILSRLENESENNRGVLASLKAHLEPICKVSSMPGKENVTDAQKHRLAKEFVPFLAQVLKLCSSGLSKLQISAEESCLMKADKFFESMMFALDCFEHVRGLLVGAPLEIELQRSWLVRRLIAWGKFQEALDQDLKLFFSLSSRAFMLTKPETVKQEFSNFKQEKFYLPNPDSARELNEGLIVLTVGAATDLIVCAAELGTKISSHFALVYETAQKLEPWLSILDDNKAQKQRSLLFKELNKCLMMRISNCSDNVVSAEKLASLTLYECAMSSLNDNFCKVVRSICSRITSQGSNNTELAIAVYEEALIKIGQIKQLQKVRGSFEMVELVECYARLRQTGKRSQDGWDHIWRAISDNSIQETAPMMSLAGLYAVSLVLAPDLSETLAFKACSILHSVIDTVQKFLNTSALLFSNSIHMNNQELSTSALTVRNFVSVYRALDFLRRSASSYTQLQWDIFIAGNGEPCILSELNGALEVCLLLFCKSIKSGLGCSCLTADELDIFQRGSKSFFLVANAAFRLSLLRQKGTKECIMLINESITDTFPGLDELRWLMSSCYNMGVQLFNMKLHKMACDPFRVSYMAAWARVSRIGKACNLESDKLADTENSIDFTNAMSDACTKSSVLVDTLNRSNESNEATKVFQKSVEQWARSSVTCLRKSFPHSLLQPWLKRVFSMKLSQDKDFEDNTIYSIIQNFIPSLPQEAAGLLLEEELLFYETVEESEPIVALEMQRKILELLLYRIYTLEHFPLHRAKILVWKGRINRIATQGDDEWLSYLTEAINILLNHVADEKYGYHTNHGATEFHLGIYYFLRAICVQETDPSSKDPMDDIYNGLNLFEKLLSSSYKGPVDQHQKDMHFQAISLLQNLSDMLALKGYYNLQYRVYSLLIDIASSCNINSEDAFLAVFNGTKLNHMFCNSPFLRSMPNLVEQKLGLNLDSKELLEGLVKKHPKGMFSVIFINILKFFARPSESTISDSSSPSSWEEIIEELQEAKANDSICTLAQAFFMMAESNCRNAKLQEALRNAKEALSLRLKLLYRFFKISAKPSMFRVAETEAVEDNQKAHYLEPLGSVVVGKWPSVNLRKHDAGPSQWQILSNYLESLMQVGTLNQMLGIIDDAENSFQEGFQIATSHSLSFVGGTFSSCLGEVQRKKHSWKLAENSLVIAKRLLNDQDKTLYCHHCWEMADAVLSSRFADLEYLRNDRTAMNSNETCNHVIEKYCNAEKQLYCLIIESCKHKNGETMFCPSKTSLSQENECLNISGNKDIVKPSCSNLFHIDTYCSSSTNRHRTGKKSTSAQKRSHGVPELKPGILNEGSNTMHGYRTRRKVAAAAKKREEDGVNELCMETNIKLAISESNAQEVGKHEIGLENTQKKRRSRLRKKTCDSVLDFDVQNSSLNMHESDYGAKLSEETIVIEDFNELSSRSQKMCWCHCNSKASFQALSIEEWLDHQLSIHAKRLMARVLLQKGKYFRNMQNIHKAHQEFYKALSLVQRGAYISSSTSDSPGVCQPACISLKEMGHYPIEESSLLYHISMLALSQEKCEEFSEQCCHFSTVDVSQALIWLVKAFLLCKEMPPLMSKVARTLAILHVPKDFGGPFEVSLINGILPLKSASYFHQISLGATARQKHLTMLKARKHSSKTATRKELEECCSDHQSIEQMEQLLRIQLSDLNDLKSAIDHDPNLPCSTICLSLVDQEMQSLFIGEKFIHHDAWLLITRFDTGVNPLSMMFHCASLPEGLGTSCCPYNLDDDDETVEGNKRSAFSSLLSQLSTILDESRQSTSGVGRLNSVEDKCRWWEWRMDLDIRLASLLRMIEEHWLGPWKSFLFGNFSGKFSETFRHSADCLKQQLECLGKSCSLNSEMIRLLLQGTGVLTRAELEKGITWMLGHRSYHFSCNKGARCRVLDSVGSSGIAETTEVAVRMFLEFFQSAEKTASSFGCVQNTENVNLHREPIVLVLDRHLQAFPWESFPSLRMNEVYRMPSIGAIQALVTQRSLHETMKKKQESLASQFQRRVVANEHSLACVPDVPSINPYDAYFLLNPSGDLESTQAAFEEMFKSQHGWEGRVGEIPTAEEYMDGLQTHELFVYFGHGSGDQYLPERRMRKMKCCAAATLLMGCSSGRLLVRGDYEPLGVPWTYLMTGCPTAIANLWDVTDGDIDRFSRVLLSKWLDSEIDQEARVASCNKVKDSKTQSLRIGHNKAALTVMSEDGSSRQAMLQGRVRTATHVGEGRDACRLPYLIGASPVCYGIPTSIRRRKNPS